MLRPRPRESDLVSGQTLKSALKLASSGNEHMASSIGDSSQRKSTKQRKSAVADQFKGYEAILKRAEMLR